MNVHRGALLLVPVTVHHFFCILHFCHTCSLCRLELVVKFPARGSTQVLISLFPGVLLLCHFLYSVGPHPTSSLYIYTFVVSRAFMAGAASQAGDNDFSGHLVSLLVCRGPWMSTVVLNCWCNLHTFMYDKRKDFNFHITNVLFLRSNIPSSPAYGVKISQLIRYVRLAPHINVLFWGPGDFNFQETTQTGIHRETLEDVIQFYGRYWYLFRNMKCLASEYYV